MGHDIYPLVSRGGRRGEPVQESTGRTIARKGDLRIIERDRGVTNVEGDAKAWPELSNAGKVLDQPRDG